MNRQIYRLVEIEEALVPAFLIEKHTDGQFTIFVLSSPTPMVGAIYILQPEPSIPFGVLMPKAMVCLMKWTAELAKFGEPVLHVSNLRKRSHSCAQWAPAIISFMIWRPVACSGPMPLPGRNHMPLSWSRQ